MSNCKSEHESRKKCSNNVKFIHLKIDRNFNVYFMRNNSFCKIFLDSIHFSGQIGKMCTFLNLPTVFVEITYFKMQPYFVFQPRDDLKVSIILSKF